MATLRPFSCGHRVAVTTFDHTVTTFLFAVLTNKRPRHDATYDCILQHKLCTPKYLDSSVRKVLHSGGAVVRCAANQ